MHVVNAFKPTLPVLSVGGPSENDLITLNIKLTLRGEGGGVKELGLKIKEKKKLVK